MKKLLSSILATFLMSIILIQSVSAHTNKSGLTHDPQYTKWDIYEPAFNSTWTCHSGSNDISVQYGDLSVLSSTNQTTFKTYIDYGIDRWAQCSFGSNFNMYKKDSGAVVKINAYSDSSDSNWGYNDFVNATTVNASGTGGKHFTSLDIYINVASTKVPTSNATRSKHVVLHELGHAIGLADLTTDLNDTTYSSYLMGRNNYTLVDPSLSEVKGAGVILGLHTSHTFNVYNYHNSTNHRTTCSNCDGYKLEAHTKGTNGLCTKCGK